MIVTDNCVHIVEDESELPDLLAYADWFCDFETTSCNRKLMSVNPWRDCWVAGICVTCDKIPNAWYIPVGHHQGRNINFETVCEWFNRNIATKKRWINHNVKYDVHVAERCLGCCITGRIELVDTLSLAKIIDSDRFSYSLDALCKAWLNEDIKVYEKALSPYLDRLPGKNKDYGLIPISVLGPYGGQDVLSNRRLFKFIEFKMPEQCKGVAATERALTSILVDMEHEGLRVDVDELLIAQYESLAYLIAVQEELEKLVGFPFEPHTNNGCHEVLCGKYGLPVLSWSAGSKHKKSEPSFDKHALTQYLAHPLAPKSVVRMIQQYRRTHTLLNTFIKPWLALQIDGILHGSFNQVLRTGRMSMRKPNLQQVTKEIKRFIHPPPGHSFISIDYSQIEFRLVAHYIQDEKTIAAYHVDPRIDFHQWVADLCQIARDPAKSVNFCMAYGGGRAKVLLMLASNLQLMNSINSESLTIDSFAHLCKQRALEVYNTYHRQLPTLKATARRAGRAVAQKGYVFNLYGRHRHLPLEKAHIAFNTLNQSSAADLVKERMVAVAEFCYEWEGGAVKPVLQVHDELLFTAPDELVSRVLPRLVHIMETPAVSIRVPIKCQAGVSNSNWLEAVKSADWII